MKIDPKEYVVALFHGKWFIGKLERHALKDALELQIQAQVKGGMLDVNYIAQPIGMFADIDEANISGALVYNVADFHKQTQDALGRAIMIGEDIKKSIKAGQNGITLATSIPRTT